MTELERHSSEAEDEADIATVTLETSLARAIPDLRWPAMQALFALVIGNPTLLATAGLHALYSWVKVGDPNQLSEDFYSHRAEYSQFAIDALTFQDEITVRVEAVETEQVEQRRLVADLADKLEKSPNLTGTEVFAVLGATEQVYQATFDPEKRVLIAAALRSLLLNRDRFRGGLRKKFLASLRDLTFGDVVTLAALVYKDDSLADLVGMGAVKGQRHARVTTTMSANNNFLALEKCGLVGKMGGGGTTGNNDVVVMWGANDLARPFLDFIEASPDLLNRLATEHEPVN